MNMLLEIITFYTVMSLVTLSLFLLVEFTGAMLKGPQFVTWLKENRTSTGSLTAKEFFLFMALWPFTLFYLIRAMPKGRTFREDTILRREEARKKAQAGWCRLVQEGAPLSATWLSKPEMTILGMTVTLHALLGMYAIREEPSKSKAVITHAIFEDHGQCFCLRVVESLQKYLPCGRHGSLSEAKQTCEADKEWIRASAPGHECELDLLVQGMREKVATTEPAL